MILLSIITPVFNNVSYISKAIENYLSQNCVDSELIIVDAGSLDGTKEVIESYAITYPSIRWVSEKDEGQSDAMNKGIKLAQGNYISFLNVDDYYSDGCLNEVCNILKKDTSIQYLVGNCNVWDQYGQLIYVNKPSKHKKWHVYSGLHFSVNPSAYFYRKSLHEIVGYYPNDNHYNMDLEMIIRFRNECDFTYFPLNWGNFRVIPNAKTYEDSKNNLLEQRKLQLISKYLKKQSLYVRFRVSNYRFYNKYQPKLRHLFLRIIDKIKFEMYKFKKK
jgi:glycosyltransferase involved in cell wall biosynthesis